MLIPLLGKHVQQQQSGFHVKRRSPSYWRRQERRKAARAAEQPILGSGVTADEASDESNLNEDNSTTEEVAEPDIVTSSEMQDPTLCQICEFKSKSEKGLKIHMMRKHANIEQLDGNVTLSEPKLNNMYRKYGEYINEVDEEVENFLKNEINVGEVNLETWE